ncbi:hypothetical protein BDF22DRAFT_741657 [Syncephalis plumigaleata]|nr:hypothetical protein BDF22DRAFT_741657 [Syncephalis plumigaleata]
MSTDVLLTNEDHRTQVCAGVIKAKKLKGRHGSNVNVSAILIVKAGWQLASRLANDDNMLESNGIARHICL